MISPTFKPGDRVRQARRTFPKTGTVLASIGEPSNYVWVVYDNEKVPGTMLAEDITPGPAFEPTEVWVFLYNSSGDLFGKGIRGGVILGDEPQNAQFSHGRWVKATLAPA